jgi:hypothetical protein
VSSRNLLNLVLLLMLAGLLALAIYEPGKPDKPIAKAITELDPAAINSVRIERPGQATVVLEKHGEQWRMQEPFVMPANSGRIQQLLRLVQAKSITSYPMSRVDANQLQLDAPSLVLTLNDQTLRFGAITAIGDSRYLQIGNTVHLITDRYSHLARGAASDFVSPALLPESTEINRIDLLSGVSQQGASQQSVKSQDEGAHSLLEEWRHARAMRVSALDKTAQPTESVVVNVDADKSVHFDVLRSESEIILQRPDVGLQYHFSLAAGQRLLTLPSPEPPAAE